MKETSERPKITSWSAYALTLLLLAGGMVWTSFYPNSPYSVFAPSAVALATAYMGKRLLQKEEKYDTSNRMDMTKIPREEIGD